MILSYSQSARFVLLVRGESAELAHDDVLRSGFEGQGEHDALHILPVVNNVLRTDFAFWFEQEIAIATGMFESIKQLVDRAIDIFVSRRELVAKQVENRKVEFVGAVGVCGMNGRLDVGGIVE